MQQRQVLPAAHPVAAKAPPAATVMLPATQRVHSMLGTKVCSALQVVSLALLQYCPLQDTETTWSVPPAMLSGSDLSELSTFVDVQAARSQAPTLGQTGLSAWRSKEVGFLETRRRPNQGVRKVAGEPRTPLLPRAGRALRRTLWCRRPPQSPQDTPL
jgi:hypothetical protein